MDLAQTTAATRTGIQGGRCCLADVVEVVKPVPFARGFLHRIRGFESHRRLQFKAPTQVAPCVGAEITTAEAMATRNSIMGFLAVDLKEIHGDLSQLPYRMPEIR